MKKGITNASQATQNLDKAVQFFDQEMRALAKEHGEKKSARTEILLKKCFNTFLQKNKFVPGQIVVWKDDMRNRRNPAYGQPAIVVEVLKEPLFDHPSEERNSAGTMFFHEPLDMGIGLVDDDGDRCVFYVDSRRFRQKQSEDVD